MLFTWLSTRQVKQVALFTNSSQIDECFNQYLLPVQWNVYHLQMECTFIICPVKDLHNEIVLHESADRKFLEMHKDRKQMSACLLSLRNRDFCRQAVVVWVSFPGFHVLKSNPHCEVLGKWKGDPPVVFAGGAFGGVLGWEPGKLHLHIHMPFFPWVPLCCFEGTNNKKAVSSCGPQALLFPPVHKYLFPTSLNKAAQTLHYSNENLADVWATKEVLGVIVMSIIMINYEFTKTNFSKLYISNGWT